MLVEAKSVHIQLNLNEYLDYRDIGLYPNPYGGYPNSANVAWLETLNSFFKKVGLEE